MGPVLTGTFEAWQEDGSFGSEGKSDGEWAEDEDGSSLEDEDGWGWGTSMLARVSFKGLHEGGTCVGCNFQASQ